MHSSTDYESGKIKRDLPFAVDQAWLQSVPQYSFLLSTRNSDKAVELHRCYCAFQFPPSLLAISKVTIALWLHRHQVRVYGDRNSLLWKMSLIATTNIPCSIVLCWAMTTVIRKGLALQGGFRNVLHKAPANKNKTKFVTDTPFIRVGAGPHEKSIPKELKGTDCHGL